ncbi:ATP-binding protein [Bradyrhizobium sp. CNPSo 4026]|nr:ATP-binding protein [Bradyrhizobium cenepequi]
MADEGIGIPPEQRSQLFGEFQRGSLRPLNGPRGSGLGLYIVRTLALRMGAECIYKSGARGGSVFRVVFHGSEPQTREIRNARSYDQMGRRSRSK